MLFEIYIHPKLNDVKQIQQNLKSFFKYKNFLDKHTIIIYTKFQESDFYFKKFKLNIQFILINDNIQTLRELWIQNIHIYENINWVIHYEIEDEIIEFDFIKMIFKKIKNIFVKKNSNDVYHNLFCINTNLLLAYISCNDKLNPEFIIKNSSNYYFLKYMNIISKNEYGENIYI